MNQHTKVFLNVWVSHWQPPPFIHSTIKHPNKSWQTVLPEKFITTINYIIQSSPPPLSGTKFRFEISNAAAIHNSSILQSHNFDMTRTIAANHNSHISYGSEFQTVEVLEPLLQKSPLWKAVSEILVKGEKYPSSASTIQNNNQTSGNPYNKEIISQQRRTHWSSQKSSRRISMQESNFRQR